MFIISAYFPPFAYLYLCFWFDLIIEFIELICLLYVLLFKSLIIFKYKYSLVQVQ